MVIYSKINDQALLSLLYIVLKCQLLKEEYLVGDSGRNHQRRLQIRGMEEGWKLVLQEHGFSESWERAQERAGRGCWVQERQSLSRYFWARIF